MESKLFLELNNLNNLNKDLENFIIENNKQNKFTFKKIGREFENVLQKTKNKKGKYVSKLRVLLFGVLYYYIYILESNDKYEVLQDLGFCNCFLFLKEIYQIKIFKKIGRLFTNIVFDKYFILNLDNNGVPYEMSRDNIYSCYGFIQWISISSPSRLPKLCSFMNIITSKIDSDYKSLLEWNFFSDNIEKSTQKYNDINHYINQENIFTLFYGLYLIEWVYYSKNFIIDILNKYNYTNKKSRKNKKTKKIKNNTKKMNNINLDLSWINTLESFKKKLEVNNLTLKNFIICLLKIENKWNPKINSNLAWLINHIPYFLSAFYQYDLLHINSINNKTNEGFYKIIDFIEKSHINIKKSSYDYYGECLEILDKLGIDKKKELKELRNEIKNKITRNQILAPRGSSFSDIHTVVTYVIKPNGYDILGDNINLYFGKEIKKIISTFEKM